MVVSLRCSVGTRISVPVHSGFQCFNCPSQEEELRKTELHKEVSKNLFFPFASHLLSSLSRLTHSLYSQKNISFSKYALQQLTARYTRSTHFSVVFRALLQLSFSHVHVGGGDCARPPARRLVLPCSVSQPASAPACGIRSRPTRRCREAGRPTGQGPRQGRTRLRGGMARTAILFQPLVGRLVILGEGSSMTTLA